MQGLYEQNDIEIRKKPAGEPVRVRESALGLVLDLVEARVQAGLATFYAELFSPFAPRKLDGGKLVRAQGTAIGDGEPLESELIAWKFVSRSGKDKVVENLGEKDFLFLLMLMDVLPTFEDISGDVGSNYVLRLSRDAFETFEEGELDETLRRFLDLQLDIRDQGTFDSCSLRVLESVRTRGALLELELNPLGLTALVGTSGDSAFAEWLCLWDARGEQPSQGTLVLLAVLVALMPLEEEDEDQMELANRELAAMLGVSAKEQARVPLDGLCRELSLLPGWELESFEEIAEDEEAFEKGELVWRITRRLVD